MIDPAQHHKDLVAAAKRNRTYAFAAVGTTGAMAIGLAVSYVQFKKYSDRVDAAVGTTELAPNLASDRGRMRDWEFRMIGFTAATIVSGMAATYFWSRSAAFTLEARSSGGALSYSGQF